MHLNEEISMKTFLKGTAVAKRLTEQLALQRGAQAVA